MSNLPYTIRSSLTDLLPRIQIGDESAFRELAEVYYESLARFAYTFVRSTDVAQDIVQDVLANLWQRRDTIRPDGNIKSYLFAAVRNASLNIQRRRHLEQQYENTVSQAEQHSTFPNSSIDDLADLRHALSLLTPRQAEALHLRYHQDLTYPEIARTLGVTVNAAEQLIQRALKTLREKLPPQ